MCTVRVPIIDIDNLFATKAAGYLAAFFCIYLASHLVVLSVAASETPVRDLSANVYYALANPDNSPSKSAKTYFDCTDKIYTVAELNDYPFGKYHFSVRWVDPHGSTRENTQYPFYVNENTGNQLRLWAWLELSRAQGAGMFAWLNPAAGLEEFIGRWQIEVRVNNKLINKGYFEVGC